MTNLSPEIGFALVQNDEEVSYETRIVKEPENLNTWLDFYRCKVREYNTTKDEVSKQNNILYQLFILKRGCGYLKRSYKLFVLYVNLRIDLIKDLNPLKYKSHFKAVNGVFDQGLVNLHKFPVIWQKYLKFLIDHQLYDLALIRKTFNAALRSLPLTQHEAIWDLYIGFADKLIKNFSEANHEVSVIVSRIYLKYLEIHPDYLEEIIDKLIGLGNYSAAIRLFENHVLSDSKFVSSQGKSSLDVHLEYSSCISGHVKQIMSTSQRNDHQVQQNLLKYDKKMENFLSNLIGTYPDQLGLIVVKLAKYFIIRKNFIKTDDVFAKYLKNCLTIKDFKLIYDSYLEFKENLIKNYLEKISVKEELLAKSPEDESLQQSLGQLNSSLDINMEVFEKLISDRKHYICDILLRQDINNCAIWLQKIDLFDREGQIQDQLNCFVDAIKKIKPSKAHFDEFYKDGDDNETGDGDASMQNEIEKKESENLNQKMGKTSGLEKIWIKYAGTYETNNDILTARRIYSSAIKVPFINANDLVDIYFAWAEMEINSADDDDEGLERAIKVLESAITAPDFKQLGIPEDKVNFFNEDLVAQHKVHKSIKLWSFYLDLVESTDDLDRIRRAYEWILKLKILTPLILINYINFLESREMFNESFQVFEVGLEKFNYYPIKFEISSLYISKLVSHYNKIQSNDLYSRKKFQYKERIRDLFEQSLNDCPSNLCKKLYLQYANFEKSEGAKSIALTIYKKCIKHLHLNSDEPVPANYFSSTSVSGLESAKLLENYKQISEVYDILVSETSKFNGLESARPVFETIMKDEVNFPSFELLRFVIEFKNLEVELKEIDRARAIFKFGVAFINYNISHPEYKKANLQAIDKFWKDWAEFELNYGNQDTYADMLRTKRDVQAK
ncbi:mRNA splicing protein [Saccharomycopsis crataegensis]|uniref:Pre-mRNA-splicing factor SYF1 n=1 Tax=Saccharomycopsis crataegensis TaxID=43959 RepID=A0AAV5QNT0_9ASCO|nr:mRNA splicing protein [Saccharomycopsis crataegensis]